VSTPPKVKILRRQRSFLVTTVIIVIIGASLTIYHRSENLFHTCFAWRHACCGADRNLDRNEKNSQWGPGCGPCGHVAHGQASFIDPVMQWVPPFLRRCLLSHPLLYPQSRVVQVSRTAAGAASAKFITMETRTRRGYYRRARPIVTSEKKEFRQAE
jgi:hypothetical protein